MGTTGPIVSAKLTLVRTLPKFTLSDHKRTAHSIDDLMGPRGMLLGFIGDIWSPISIERILYMQVKAKKFAQIGFPAAIIVQGRVSTLANFMLNSPLVISVPLLADPDGKVQGQYEASKGTALMLIDRSHVLRYTWQVSDEKVWPPTAEVLTVANNMRRIGRSVRLNAGK